LRTAQPSSARSSPPRRTYLPITRRWELLRHFLFAHVVIIESRLRQLLHLCGSRCDSRIPRQIIERTIIGRPVRLLLLMNAVEGRLNGHGAGVFSQDTSIRRKIAVQQFQRTMHGHTGWLALAEKEG